MRIILTLVMAVFALSAAAQQPFPGDSARALFYGEPYLQYATPTGVSVMYQTTCSVHSWIELGRDSLHVDTLRQLIGGQEVVHDAEHRIRLADLQPGATYWYRVCATQILQNQSYSKTFGRTERTRFYRFTLPADTVRSFTALVFNDLHCVRSVEQAMARLADSIPHDFVVFNGDCLPEPADRRQALDAVHALADAFDAAETPCIFLRGNHEIRNAYSSGMLSLFDFGPAGTTYHAFSWGDTRFVLLDCGEDKPDDTWVYYGLNDFTAFRRDQAAFLADEVRSRAYRRAARRVLIHHIPLWFSDAAHDPGGESAPCRELWAPVLAKAPVDLAINGHTHRFQFYEEGQYGNLYPMLIGGGPSLRDAAVVVLEKRGRTLRAKVLDAAGSVLFERTW